MFIKIPVKYHKYIQMLVEAKCFDDEEKAKTWVFEDGLSEAEFDISMGSTEPDMDLSLLKGKPITVELNDKPEHRERLESISQGFSVTIVKAATISFLLGLFNQYLLLKSSKLYQKDKHFRKTVSEMPHEWLYDQSVPNSEGEYPEE